MVPNNSNTILHTHVYSLGSHANKNDILIRQRGFNWYAGENVNVGRDYTIHASAPGKVRFNRDHDKRKTYINIDPDPVPDYRVPVGHLIDYSVMLGVAS